MIKILIGDDHPIVMNGLSQVIRQYWPDAHIHMVETGRQLIKKGFSENWDLIISDINFPDISGIDVVQIMAQYPASPPILIMSMYSSEEYALPVKNAGAKGFISKTKIHEQLPSAIKTILAGKNYFVTNQWQGNTEINAEDPPHRKLSPREKEIMIALAKGNGLTQIAKSLKLELPTVSTYRLRVLKKMGFKNNAEIVAYCINHNLLYN